jgi:hypothetical protein
MSHIIWVVLPHKWFSFEFLPSWTSFVFQVSSFFGELGTYLGVEIRAMTLEEHIWKSIWPDPSRAQSWGILRKVWKNLIWSGDFPIYVVLLVFLSSNFGIIFLAYIFTSPPNFIWIRIDLGGFCLLGESFWVAENRLHWTSALVVQWSGANNWPLAACRPKCLSTSPSRF